MPDFKISGGGSVYLLHPISEAAKDWVDNNIPADAQHLGNAVAVEHRYIGSIACGIQDDGLEVEFE